MSAIHKDYRANPRRCPQGKKISSKFCGECEPGLSATFGGYDCIDCNANLIPLYAFLASLPCVGFIVWNLYVKILSHLKYFLKKRLCIIAYMYSATLLETKMTQIQNVFQPSF